MPRRSKYRSVRDSSDGREFRSKLERYTYDQLTAAGIPFTYEEHVYELLGNFYHEFDCWEPKIRKGQNVFTTLSNKVRPITYTPDFVGNGWIIETKGFLTPDFKLKWKMFKAFLVANNLHYTLFLPTSQKMVDLVIQIILNQLQRNETDKL